MDQPGNYTIEWAKQMRALKDKELNGLIAGVERDAVHFQLPDCGIVLGRDYQGTIKGRELRPPFPVTAIEYSALYGPYSFEYPVASSKRLIIAVEDEGYGEGAVTILPCFYIDQKRQWSLPVLGWYFPFDDVEYALRRGSEIDTVVHPRVLNKDMLNRHMIESGFSEDAYMKTVLKDASDEIVSYWDMCKALSLNAVDERRVDPDPGKQRMRRALKKPPLYSYRVLTLKPGDVNSHREHKGGTHASPVSHWRRGHMRTIKKTGKQVWVRPSLINGEGMAVKDYRVEAL